MAFALSTAFKRVRHRAHKSTALSPERRLARVDLATPDVEGWEVDGRT